MFGSLYQQMSFWWKNNCIFKMKNWLDFKFSSFRASDWKASDQSNSNYYMDCYQSVANELKFVLQVCINKLHHDIYSYIKLFVDKTIAKLKYLKLISSLGENFSLSFLQFILFYLFSKRLEPLPCIYSISFLFHDTVMLEFEI